MVKYRLHFNGNMIQYTMVADMMWEWIAVITILENRAISALTEK